MSGKILNIVGVVWVVGALVTLGYFAVRGMAAEPGPVKHLLPVRAETPAPK